MIKVTDLILRHNLRNSSKRFKKYVSLLYSAAVFVHDVTTGFCFKKAAENEGCLVASCDKTNGER